MVARLGLISAMAGILLSRKGMVGEVRACGGVEGGWASCFSSCFLGLSSSSLSLESSSSSTNLAMAASRARIPMSLATLSASLP